MSNVALEEIQAAIQDLRSPSETDSTFEIVHWKKQGTARSSADLLSLIGKPSGLPIQDVGLEKCFQDLTQNHEWHDADGKKTVEKYRKLLTVLKERLTDVKVFKVGEVVIDIYIVGRTAEDDWVGVVATDVET